LQLIAFKGYYDALGMYRHDVIIPFTTLAVAAKKRDDCGARLPADGTGPPESMPVRGLRAERQRDNRRAS